MATGAPRQKVTKLKLRLYVAGHAANSVQALSNLRALCNEHFPSGHDLEVVDVLDHPRRAMEDGIVVTPTLLKLYPTPVQRIVGGLSDAAQLLRVLAGT
ncbi:MAG: circadian clock KaiB family protein [Gemmatimonadaceae bacterium]|nr:circadian clock KaiB family protein [Gemmatimonadaceae bacterium]